MKKNRLPIGRNQAPLRRFGIVLAVSCMVACGQPPRADQTMAERVSAGGWTESEPIDTMRIWHDADGNVLSLTTPQSSESFLAASDVTELQRTARQIAADRDGGLIEVELSDPGPGQTASLIYKRSRGMGFTFTGMLMQRNGDAVDLWTVAATERGTTGVREAIVTGELMRAGEMTIEEYQRSFAQDPYDPDYTGVDRRVLRFRSDDARYDSRFPEHPLTKVRSALAMLRDNGR